MRPRQSSAACPLQIPFPSDLNTGLVVKKGGKGKFKLVLAFLLVQPSSERDQFDDSVSMFPWWGLGWE